MESGYRGWLVPFGLSITIVDVAANPSRILQQPSSSIVPARYAPIPSASRIFRFPFRFIRNDAQYAA